MMDNALLSNRKAGVHPTAAMVIILLFLSGVELAAIAWRTNGHVLFSLDDPYIHLGMAYRLFHNLHYGLNAAEVSSPSSSIIFPFLLVPLIAVGLGQVSNLLICLLSTIGSGFLLCEILSLAGYQFKAIGLPTFTLLAVMFAFDTNLVGVAFTGMEHSLQIMLCLACLLGAQKLGKTKRPGWLLMVGAAAAPLVRYECISILLGTVLLLVWYRNFRSAAGLLVIGGLPLIAFSLFLCAHAWLHCRVPF